MIFHNCTFLKITCYMSVCGVCVFTHIGNLEARNWYIDIFSFSALFFEVGSFY